LPLYLSDPGETGRSGLMVPRATSVDVDVITLDEYARRTETRPQLVKIDVEGAEAGVIRGMSELLRTVKPVLILELHVTKGAVEHATHAEVAELLDTAGYEYKLIDSDDPHSDVPVRSHIIATPRVQQAP
jgi:hypothetical protein